MANSQPVSEISVQSFTIPIKYLLRLAALAVCPIAASAALLINGAGTNFPQPMYMRWFERYTLIDDSVRFDYVGVGSNRGQSMLLGSATDFAAADMLASDSVPVKSQRILWHLPTVASAVAVCDNLVGFPAIRLDGPTLAAIFLGKITRWNDPEIVAQNPDKNLPDHAIVVIHPLERGALTEAFCAYLAAVSPEWRAKFGHGETVTWPSGPGAFGNPGVARLLGQTRDAIALLELSAAKRANVPLVAVRNKAGNYVLPDADTVAEAATSAAMPDDLRMSLVDAPGTKAYPIGILTWLLVDPNFKDSAKGRKLVAFLKWVYTDGEAMAPSMGFVSLPSSVRERVLARIDRLNFASTLPPRGADLTLNP